MLWITKNKSAENQSYKSDFIEKPHLNRIVKPPTLNKLKKSNEKLPYYSIISPGCDIAIHLHHRSALIYLIYWKSMTTFGRSSWRTHQGKRFSPIITGISDSYSIISLFVAFSYFLSSRGKEKKELKEDKVFIPFRTRFMSDCCVLCFLKWSTLNTVV